MFCRKQFALLGTALLLASVAVARGPLPAPQEKDYLSESEADKIRDAGILRVGARPAIKPRGRLPLIRVHDSDVVGLRADGVADGGELER